MKIGFTGHQKRNGADWIWTKAELNIQLSKFKEIIGYTSLAAGSDQMFATAVINLGGKLITVVPRLDYETFFEDQVSRNQYKYLLRMSDHIVNLQDNNSPERSFYNAGEFIVNHSDMIFSVWDGKPPVGFGGTADIVNLARSKGRKVFRIDPVMKMTEWVQ